ncbi:hypothetical protein ABZ682_30125 [Streptomyces griseoviridis]|uniref:hypothetical protein n=1 Tax=Streptomyces TaxID=1883 RepID=UPI002476D75E|nr:hypothetical protein [Streptomyces sp. MAA16]MDH6696831.1 hypothetical protein [Streptomyces sp. MAA16]
MYDMDMAGLAWYEAARGLSHGDLAELDTRFKEAARAKRLPDKNFQIAARAALSTES